MKKLSLLILSCILIQSSVSARSVVFKNDDGKFGLKDEKGNITVEAQYKKLIRIGEDSWLTQKGSKFGLMVNTGKFVVEPKYSYAERVLGKYVKLGKGSKMGLFDEYGFTILPVEFSSIDLLYGGMFLTCRNYKYGVTDMNGQMILDNVFDDIYMPKPNTMVLVYNGQTFEIKRGKETDALTLPTNIQSIQDNSDFTITELITKPGVTTGYYGVTATNYFLKIFSSISPAYEETIDELMFSKGADAAGVIMNFSWIPKFPFVYAKKYYQNLIAPNNGPLSGVKTNLKRELINAPAIETDEN